ncbi:sensor domain-containing diguanylate cyclase [Deinococcus marmoris]|uniref:Diguanylate cyclase/phosphodiesterase (GGDEF & EAL domains) with PAS/PAC sensor(S) n=1 Tax=Deinococcus marmoris TaxID=249408 RepID=A0A1U7NTJ3_9DEIO|nr:diguanylate cyclase [Deinococcus marmoris]OLV16248.1 diguanylate cyclase/phosphodiesterase (GGDEF & EAL domains) with PAS/PAC sensor(s) [Deinococcus marmoris]
MPNAPTTPLLRYRHLVEVLASLARSSYGVEAVVQAVHEQTGTLFPGHATLLALRQPAGDWLWELYEGNRRYTQRLPFYPDGVIESVLHGEALSVPDIYAHLDAHPARMRRLLDDDQVILDIDGKYEQPDQPALSMLFVPLEVRAERMGVLSIQSYEVDAFDDTDLGFLELLAQHVSIALENAALREELERLTRTDMLTGLPNRRAFYHDAPLALAAARQDGKELRLIMLDVHEFKRINDGFGHQVGDAVLSTLGKVLRQTVLLPELAVRLGGDEFALLIWGMDEQLDQLIARLSQNLRAASWPSGLGPIRLHGGVAHPPLGESVDEWLSLADAQMYRAKRQRLVGGPVTWGLDFGDGLR